MSSAGARGRLHERGLFSILDEVTREALTRKCKVLRYEPGQIVFMQGSEQKDTFIIERGLVRTYYVSEAGREITLGHWNDGHLVGGPHVFGGGFHIWSGVASRHTTVFGISGAALREFAKQNSDVYPWLLDVMCFKLHWLSILFQVHGTEQVQRRMLKLLLMLGDLYGEETPEGLVITHTITQGDLANLLGASRQWTNKMLNGLASQGLIEIGNGRIILKQLSRIKAIMESNAT